MAGLDPAIHGPRCDRYRCRRRRGSTGQAWTSPVMTNMGRVLQKKPAGGCPAGRKVVGGCSLLKAYAHQAFEGVGVALEIVNGLAVAPAIFETEIDKRYRAPEQIGVRYRQELVVGLITCCVVRTENVGVHIVPNPAGINRRPQIVGPPMLVPDPPAIRVGGSAAHHRIIGLAGGGVDGVPLRTGQRVDQAKARHQEGRAEIRRDPGTVGALVGDLGAAADTKAEIILAQRAGLPENGWTSPLTVPP